MDKITYWAEFDPGVEGEEGFTVTFPDLPGCITEGDDLEEAERNAKAALSLHLYGLEEEGMEIPAPSKNIPSSIEPGVIFVPITVWMDVVRDELRNKAVNKTVTLPKWLEEESKKAGLNFSQVLQTALKQQLGIQITSQDSEQHELTE